MDVDEEERYCIDNLRSCKRYNIEIAHSHGEFYADIDALRVDDESANGLVVLMMIEETCKVKYIHLD